MAQRTVLSENKNESEILDTRSKIIGAAEAERRLQSEPDLLALHADLDPVYAPHAEALRSFERPLLILLEEKPDAYLSLQARAEMAASLACVRYVATEPLKLAKAQDLRPQEAAWRATLENVVLHKSAIPERKAT